MELLLKDFVPDSELVVKRSNITKARFPVIDFHGHFGPLVLGEDYLDSYDTKAQVERFKSFGVEKITNLELVWGEALKTLLGKVESHKEDILTFSSVDVTRLEDRDFPLYVRETIKEAVSLGVKGLKFWKNLGLTLQDSKSRYIRLDDSRLDVIWKVAGEYSLPILIHVADPVAFFKPITPTNERYEELSRVPDWSFCKAGLFSFEELLAMQESMIARNPKTLFVVAHGGSYSENLGYVAKMLDQYPNMHIDIAARLNEFGRQPYTAREFFKRYQTRILFGTDSCPNHWGYLPYFRFLETFDEYFPYSNSKKPGQGLWHIYGIGLEDAILKDVYWNNAARILGIPTI